MLSPGDIVDRYEVEAVIGTGGTAVVYRVRHRQLSTRHALKVLSVTSQTIRERMIREGQVQAALRHLNVVAVTDVLQIDDAPGLLLEYIEGPSLEDALRKYRLSVADGELLFNGILSGVRHAHAHGLVHRDLKPANVLLARTAEGYVPKVTDFGLAKVLQTEGEGTGTTRNGIAMGTPHYMAPEQIRDARNVDQRADVFSLGCLLYELCTGHRTFPGDEALAIYNAVIAGEYTPARELVPDLEDRLDIAIKGALCIDPKKRIPDCDTLAAVMKGEQTWSPSGKSLPSSEPTAPLPVRSSNAGGRTSLPPQPARSVPADAPVLPIAARGPDGTTPPPAPERSNSPRSLPSGGTASLGLQSATSESESETHSRPALDSSEVSLSRMRAPSPTDLTLGAGDASDPSFSGPALSSEQPTSSATNPLWLVALFGGVLIGGISALGLFAVLVAALALGTARPPPNIPPTVVPANPPPISVPAPPGPAGSPSTTPVPAQDPPPDPPVPSQVKPLSVPASTPEPKPAPTTTSPTVLPPIAQDPPAVAAMGTVKILSVPPTAAVSIDGKAMTPTPLKTEIKPGKHDVVVTSGDRVGTFTIETQAGVEAKWCYAFAAQQVYAGNCPK